MKNSNYRDSLDILIEDTSVFMPGAVSGSASVSGFASDFTSAENMVRHHQAIAIADGKILEILPQKEAAGKYRARQVVREPGKLWMPGLVDGHMHTGQQLLKGKILDELPMIWTRIMLPFESTLTPEKMKFSAELAALEMIKSGTTGFVDAGSYYMDAAAEIYAVSGLRGALSCSTMDQGNLPDSIRQTAKEAVESTDTLYRDFHGEGNLKVFYSLRALMNCSEMLIQMASEHARERGTALQAHMNEYAGEVNYTLEKYRMRPMEYLDSLHVLGPDFLAAHCIMLSPKEMDLLAENQVKVVHCPFSNCGKGVPDTPALLEKGVSIGLGSDGTAHGGLSLWNEMKIFRSVMNAFWGCRRNDPAVMPAAAVLKMAVQGISSILQPQDQRSGNLQLESQQPQDQRSGNLQLESQQSQDQQSENLRCNQMAADLISINWNSPHLLVSGNYVNTLLECVTAADVSDSMVNGRFLMRNREILTLDEEKILWKARKYQEESGGNRL